MAGESRGGRRELDRAKCLRRRNTRGTDRDHQGTPKTLEVDVTFVSERPLVFEGSLALNGLDFGVGEKGVDLPCLGVFEMEDGKIKVWRDYFDMATFAGGMS